MRGDGPSQDAPGQVVTNDKTPASQESPKARTSPITRGRPASTSSLSENTSAICYRGVSSRANLRRGLHVAILLRAAPRSRCVTSRLALLADPTRARLLTMLEQGEATVQVLAEHHAQHSAATFPAPGTLHRSGIVARAGKEPVSTTPGRLLGLPAARETLASLERTDRRSFADLAQVPTPSGPRAGERLSPRE